MSQIAIARPRSQLAVLVLIGLIVAGCGATTPVGPSLTPGAPSSAAASDPVASEPAPVATETPGTSPGVVEGRLADLAYLVERLKAIHPDPFLEEGEAAFMERVASIQEDLTSMTDAGFLVAVMDLMGHRDRDGHSGAWAMPQTGSVLKAWPIWLWDFPDGMRVIAAREPYADLVGARVTMVGGASTEDAIATVESLVPRDNPSSFRSNLPIYLTLPEVLAELGLIQDGDPGLTLELLDGTTREVTPDALPMEAFRDWIFGAYGGIFPESLPPDADGPLYLRHRDVAFWSAPLTKPAGLYVGYNVITGQGSDGRSISDIASAVTAAAAATPPRPIVIDLRNNGGGDNNTYLPLRNAVEAVAHAHPGLISLIAGRATFSAAGNFVTDLLVGRERAGIRLVGEPPGGGLNINGDARFVTLPNSGIIVLIASRHHEKAPGDDRLELTPDLPVEISWADYAAGRDPVLAAARKP